MSRLFALGASWIGTVTALLLVAPATFADKNDESAGFAMSRWERAIVQLTNEERKKRKLPPLKPNPKLFAAARQHSIHMARRQQMAHELDGSVPHQRVAEAGYHARSLGENVAFGQRSPRQVVQTWMKSPGHRKNILNRRFTEIGVGVARSRRGLLYFTQVFGRPGRR